MKFKALFLAFLLAGCSAQSQLTQQLTSDEKRGNEIAQAYGTPELKQCSTYIDSISALLGGTQGLLDKLKAEPTSGLYSAAMKAALIAYYTKQSIDVNSQQIAKDFALNCGALEAAVRVQIIQDAIKFRR